MIVKAGLPGLAFDVDVPLTGAHAADFKAAGYDTCIRYIPRTSALVKGNLTTPEISAILGAGLSLGVVQHTPLPGYQPTAALGALYGQYAGQYSADIGLPAGINVWLDLEEVSATATPDDVINYCREWFTEVQLHGYVPGIYVGWNVKISEAQLYSLPVRHYWRAYNCNQSIPTRGYQIVQHTQKTLNDIAFDPNTIQPDNLGDLPIFLFAS
jgi:hypothetical protein